jgi:hypothetical protein
VSTTSVPSLFGLDPATYEPHEVHRGGRSYHETNCYADIFVELLHARGDEPLAAMGSILRVDFEGDQWTFFKPAPHDLERLFGVDVHEMQPYRPLTAHITEQLEAGRTVVVELDAWWLPDTAATSYRSAHVKTSVIPEAIDVANERLVYFHNTTLHALEGEDFRQVLRVEPPSSGDVLPPYTEIVRFDAGPRLQGAELRAAARESFAAHLARRPSDDPFTRFAARLEQDLPDLLAGDEQGYHDYAFATVRMVGSAFEVGASAVEWLLEDEGAAPAADLERIVEGCKVLSFRLARRRPFDPGPVLAELGEAWTSAMSGLDRALR